MPLQENPSPTTILTIGYGNSSLKRFISLLKKFSVEYLLDVRSSPYSRFNPQFSKEPLENILKQEDIRYVFMGRELGGKPDDENCYTNGKVDYNKLQTQSYYLEGIQRIEAALQKQLRIALMCSELQPERCHRSKLIGQTLAQRNIDVQHICQDGALMSQQMAIDRLNRSQLNLFEQSYTSRNIYRKPE